MQKVEIWMLTYVQFIIRTSSEDVNNKLQTGSAVPDAEGHPLASKNQPIKSQSQSDSNSSTWSCPCNLTSTAQIEQCDPQANVVTSVLSTPEKPATLDNAKVLLRKADKILFAKMPRSYNQAEEESETLKFPSYPWSSPSSIGSENDLKKARGLLRAAHRMLEFVGIKRNDEVWRRGLNRTEGGSPVRSTEFVETEIVNWTIEKTEETNSNSILQNRIRDLEARLQDVLAALEDQREINRQLQQRLSI